MTRRSEATHVDRSPQPPRAVACVGRAGEIPDRKSADESFAGLQRGLRRALESGVSLRQVLDDIDGRRVRAEVNVVSSAKLAQLAGQFAGGGRRAPGRRPRTAS